MVKYFRTKHFVRIKENFGIYKIRNRQITLYCKREIFCMPWGNFHLFHENFTHVKIKPI